MSFTAEVKEEVVRIQTSCTSAQKAELSALLQVCGTLDLKGKGRFDLKVATETGSVARMLLKRTHGLYDLQTKLIERRSLLHNSRNYLVFLEHQPRLESALQDMGIMDKNKHLSAGLPPSIKESEKATSAFLRGCFMASGYIAKPTVAFRLELKFANESLAQEVVSLLADANIITHYAERNHAFYVRLKNFNDIVRFLYIIGAEKIVKAFVNVRHMKSARDAVNRLVNAEIANSKRASDAAAEQLYIVRALASRETLFAELAPALQAFCKLRMIYPSASLSALGTYAEPPLSKSAVNHQWQRVRHIYEHAIASQEDALAHVVQKEC